MAEKRKVYWDACIWFALIKKEPGRFEKADYVLTLAKRGEVEIWTSTLTLAEVFRKQCGDTGDPHSGILESQDQEFEEFISQDFVVLVQVDQAVGVGARRLLRRHASLRKPPDALHLATAAHHNLDEFHTFDEKNLLPLNGSVWTRAGSALKISEPPDPPLDLFSAADAQERARATVANNDHTAATAAVSGGVSTTTGGPSGGHV